MDINYYQKYLKYKIKYTKFKSQYGGGECILKTGSFISKKDRPICQILFDKECNDVVIVNLTLDHKKEMLRDNCPPTIAELTRWYRNDKKKIVAFDILGFKETKLLYTTQHYIEAGYTLEDVLESLLLIYARDPKTYDGLFNKVKKLIEELPFVLSNYNNFMLFIKNLIVNKSKINYDNYTELMSVIKKKLTETKSTSTTTTVDEKTNKLMLFIQKINPNTMSPIERGIVQALFINSQPPNIDINIIYAEIDKELFKIDLTFLNEQMMRALISEYRDTRGFIEGMPLSVIEFIAEKIKSLTIPQIKELFCILTSNCIRNFLDFFIKYFKKIKTKSDIDLLLLDNPEAVKDSIYYSTFLSYFPDKAIEFAEELDIYSITSLLDAGSSPSPRVIDVMVKILSIKLPMLLDENKYVEFYELLNKLKIILNEDFFFQQIKTKKCDSEYMKAILQKFLDAPYSNIDMHFAKLMITASRFGFVITSEAQIIYNNIKKNNKWEDNDVYYMQYYWFYTELGLQQNFDQKAALAKKFELFLKYIADKKINFSGIQISSIETIVKAFQYYIPLKK